MTYTERHRWCTAKILETFKDELDSETAQNFLRQKSVLQQFSIFFKGEGSGRLFVFYQPAVTNTEVSSYYIYSRYHITQ
jgi:hypothetical protein